ncbi:hypothetical protein ACI2KS_26535 [Pseudomonas sp. NPDC087358]
MRHSASRYREQAHAYSGVSLRQNPAMQDQASIPENWYSVL